MGGFWGAPGSLLAAPGAVFAPLGPLLAAPGALLEGILSSRGPPLGALWASFSGAFGKIRNSSKPLFFQWFLMVLASPGGPKSTPDGPQNRSWARLGASWRSLGASWRCFGVSWRPLGSLGASQASLGPLLGAICSSNIKPGYRGTGSALKARVASTARKARAARAARTGRARAPAP